MDDSEQLQQSKTREATMEQRIVTTSDDGEQPQQRGVTEAAVERQIAAIVAAMALLLTESTVGRGEDVVRTHERWEDAKRALNTQVGDSMASSILQLYKAL